MSEILTFNVMKQNSKKYKCRYRFRLDGEDYGRPFLNSLEAFRVKYSKNMNEEDIEQVEADWGNKIINKEYADVD